MQGSKWLMAAAIAGMLIASGCEREASVPEPKIPEKAQLPAINDRIEREADEGPRGNLPAQEPEAGRPSSSTGQ